MTTKPGWFRATWAHAAAAVGMLANVSTYLLIDDIRDRTVAFYATSLLGAAVLAVASLRGGMPVAWRRLAAGLGAALLAGALSDLGSRSTPQVALTSVLGIGGLLLIASGFIVILRASKGGCSGQSRIDASLLALGAVYAAWELVVGPHLESSDDPFQLIVLLLLIGLQTVISWFLLARVMDGHRFTWSELYLSSAVLLPLVGILGATIGDPAALSIPGSWIGIVNFSAVWMVAAGAIHKSALDPVQSAPVEALEKSGIAFVAAALMAPPIIGMFGPQGAPHIGHVAFILMSALVIARFVLAERRRNALSAEVEQTRTYFSGLIWRSSDPVVVIDETGLVSYASPAAVEHLGLSPTMTPERSFTEEDRPKLLNAIQAARGGVEIVEADITRQVGSKVRHYQLKASKMHDPSSASVILNFHDVTDRVELAANLLHLSRHDPLTGLFNRRETMDRMYLELARRDHPLAALIYIDLDGFKPINDAYGHESGDAVLVEVSRRLRASVRPSDTVARFGGDEFVIFCPSIGDEQGAHRVATRALKAITRPIRLGQQSVMVGASIGLAMSGTEEMTPEELLRLADEHMYVAKQEGGARIADAGNRRLRLAR